MVNDTAGDPMSSRKWSRKSIYSKESEKVGLHDFRSHALGVAYPYGIYEPLTNRGLVVVGTSYDTPEFAVEAIAMWLKCSGVARSSNSNHFF